MPAAPGYPPNPNMMAAQAPNSYAPRGPMPLSPMMSPQGYPIAQVNVPQQYQGPQAPSPTQPQVQQPINPIRYNPAPAPQPTTNMAMDRRQAPTAGAASTELAQIIQVLRESPYPAQREWAANALASYDWRVQPEVARMLLLAAQQDPAALVRAGCVYSLGRMNAASEPVISTLYTLRNDQDPRVRQEVEQALVRLGAHVTR